MGHPPCRKTQPHHPPLVRVLLASNKDTHCPPQYRASAGHQVAAVYCNFRVICWTTVYNWNRKSRRQWRGRKWPRNLVLRRSPRTSRTTQECPQSGRHKPLRWPGSPPSGVPWAAAGADRSSSAPTPARSSFVRCWYIFPSLVQAPLRRWIGLAGCSYCRAEFIVKCRRRRLILSNIPYR